MSWSSMGVKIYIKKMTKDVLAVPVSFVSQVGEMLELWYLFLHDWT